DPRMRGERPGDGRRRDRRCPVPERGRPGRRRRRAAPAGARLVNRHRFEGKGVVVTGAASGIGREIAWAFADEGAAVVGVDLRDADGVRTIVADLGDPEAVSTVIPAAGELLDRIHA